MSRQTGLFAVWIIAATLALDRFWFAFPQIFPPFPERVWTWLAGLHPDGCCEAMADIEAVVSLVLSFLTALATTWLGRRIWRRLRPM